MDENGPAGLTEELDCYQQGQRWLRGSEPACNFFQITAVLELP
jgi:hypothetical protein